MLKIASLLSVAMFALTLAAFAPSFAADDEMTTTATPVAKPKMRDYIFGCKNDWQQAVDVTVTAMTEDEARKILKTEDQYVSNYNNCAYRRDTPAKRKRKAVETPTE